MCGKSREEEGAELPPIAPHMKEVIDGALMPYPQDDVLVDKYNIKITRHDIDTLSKCNWLNDEVINFYFSMIEERF